MQRNAMRIIFILAAMLITSFAVMARAQSPTTQPSSLSAASGIDEILDALDARGKNLKDFSADVKLTNIDNATGDETASSGTVLFQHLENGDSRIRVNFTKKQRDNKTFAENHQYILDKGWLVDRDYQAKKEVRRQVTRPGQKIDLLKLGEGPFPLPIGQNKDDVKKIFDVEKVAPAKDDPAGTVHLKLTPKADTTYSRQFKTIDVWVETTGAMPRRITTKDVNGTADKQTDLTNIKPNAGTGDADFKLDDLPPSGWDQIVEPFGQN
jgi:outer membrane lipoprotein-sorting protein